MDRLPSIRKMKAAISKVKSAVITPKAAKNKNGSLLEPPTSPNVAAFRYVKRLKRETVLDLNIHSVGESCDSESEEFAQNSKRVRGITVYNGEEIIAWLMFRDVETVHIHVKESYRRMGIGSKLFKMAEEMKKILLFGDRWDRRSTKFYNKVEKHRR